MHHPTETTTLRGLAPLADEPTLLTLRRTLQGLGPGSRPAHPPCPVCRLTLDDPPPELGPAFGIALCLAKGAAEAHALLCEMHRRLVTLLLREIAEGPSRIGDRPDW